MTFKRHLTSMPFLLIAVLVGDILRTRITPFPIVLPSLIILATLDLPYYFAYLLIDAFFGIPYFFAFQTLTLWIGAEFYAIFWPLIIANKLRRRLGLKGWLGGFH